ncbi:hypothetical protein AUC60_20500 [Pseudomonas caspiana]|uniref:Uncharacterized protein n=1 Tax=Pseudomonas caspiana TaxID=1451454 RepID=A0A1Y3P0P8_9PSED|nr:hypothetical protein AUC60_20500 [Pseudomonas caspiana]
MARRAYRQDVGMVLKKTRFGGFFVAGQKVACHAATALFQGLDRGDQTTTLLRQGNIYAFAGFTLFRQLSPSRPTG